MASRAGERRSRRDGDRVIIHFDYDSFYAAVVENENPELKSRPLAIQQKQIVVTCNYEARRRGLYKLQLITEAKRVCPDVVIVVGEDLTRFRDASKALYGLLRSFSWNGRVERLGFDEVWMDVSDIVDYNVDVLNKNDLSRAFFQLSSADPTAGFDFDARNVAGHAYPPSEQAIIDETEDGALSVRLVLASHLALYLRRQLVEQQGYNATVGVATSKLLSKLVGNTNKPNDQTTLLPPYDAHAARGARSNVSDFLDGHDIGRIPGVGFKLAQKLRELVLGRPADFDPGLVYGPTKESVSVLQVRTVPGLSPELLDKVLSAPGMPHGIGAKVYDLIHGIDDSEVAPAQNVPKQISIEDSYLKLDTLEQVFKELVKLSKSLIQRMRTDLTETMGEEMQDESARAKWLAYPTTLRLSTRPRPPMNADGTRSRRFNRISKSVPLPGFVFSLTAGLDKLAQRLAGDVLLPLFRKLHPEQSGWDLSLVNIAVTGIDEKQTLGGDIESIFRRKNELATSAPQDYTMIDAVDQGSLLDADAHDVEAKTSESDAEWHEDSDEEASSQPGFTCPMCGVNVPAFASAAHERFHNLEV